MTAGTAQFDTAVGLQVACTQPCILGEGPVWDDRCQMVHWVDIRAPALLSLDPATGITSRRPMPSAIGFVALTPDPGVVVAGLKDGLYALTLATGAATLLVHVDADKPSNRINDGTVGPDGAILFGTLDVEHQTDAGSYWRYRGGVLTALGGRMIVTNGPAVSADGTWALTIDSINRRVYRQSYTEGRFGPPSLFAEVPLGQGVPDGATFDAADCVWIAHYGGGRVTRYRADGSIERVVSLPAQQVTKCAFGGPDMKTLYITTAAHRRSLADEPLAGCLFKLQTDVPGVKAHLAIV